MKTIRFRLMASYTLLFFLIIIFLEFQIYMTVREYYMTSITAILKSSGQSIAQYYAILDDAENITSANLAMASILLKGNDSTYQLLDENGLLIDGEFREDKYAWMQNTPDIKQALGGKIGIWSDRAVAYDGRWLIVSRPIIKDNKFYGVVRTISKITKVDENLNELVRYLMGITGAALLLVLIVGFLISRAITKPLVKMVGFAQKMSHGNYSMRIVGKHYGEAEDLASALNQMAEQIETLETLKTVFLASITHELKTPLTSIKGWSLTLTETAPLDKSELAEGLKFIEMEADRLTSMVEQLLDFASYASGSNKLHMDEFNLQKLLTEVIEQCKPNYQNLDLAVEWVQMGTQGEQMVRADRNKIRQVVLNLFDNAGKFTPPGGRIRLDSLVDSSGFQFSVEDNGCGIAAEELTRVIERFYKVSTEKRGNGIGLSICQEIIHMHGGNLKIESELGKWTKVTVHIPMEVG